MEDNLNHKEQLIDRFLSGLMSEKERNDFLESLEKDADLKASYEEMKLVYDTIKIAGRNELKSKLSSFEQEEIENRGKIVPLFLRRLGALAAVLVIAIGIFYFLQDNTPTADKLFAENFEVYQNPTNIRITEGENSNWTKASEFYANQDFENAIKSFEASSKEKPVYLIAFYLGSCLLSIEPPKLNEAIENFDIVLQTDNDYQEQANWYKALALLKLSRIEEAGQIFQSISEEENYKAEAASDILKTIKKLLAN